MRAVFIRYFWRFWGALGIANFVIGIAGVPGDIDTWTRWLGRVMSDPIVLKQAAYAVEIAQFVNQIWVRVALVAVGLLMILWPLRWFWRLRHKVKFRWRRLMDDQVWIARVEALTLMKESEWGRIKSPTVTRRVRSPSVFDSALLGLGGKEHDEVVSGLPEQEKAKLKFNAYIDQALDQFVSDNPDSMKKSRDGTDLIDETTLRVFLKRAMQNEVRDEFGSVPSFKL